MDRMSSQLPRYQSKAVHRASFEETWPRHEFAELVRLALAAGAWLVRMRQRMPGRRPAILGSPLPGGINPAEWNLPATGLAVWTAIGLAGTAVPARTVGLALSASRGATSQLLVSARTAADALNED